MVTVDPLLRYISKQWHCRGGQWTTWSMSQMLEISICSDSPHTYTLLCIIYAQAIQNEAQKCDLGFLNAYFLGLAGASAAKDDICKFQEGRNYILLTSAHLELLPNLLFFTPLSFLSKAFKIHSFLSLSINIIPSNPVLRGHQENWPWFWSPKCLSFLVDTWEKWLQTILQNTHHQL